MKHAVKLSPQDKAQVWIDLCDFSLRLMESALDRSRIEEKFRRMREEDLRGHAVGLGILRISARS